MAVHDRLSDLYRYNVTQTSILAKDYPDFDVTGRACEWVPDHGIYLYNDLPAGQAGIAFGIIQRVFVTGYKPADLKDGQKKGRTVTVVQHGLIPGLVAQHAIGAGRLVSPITSITAANKGKFNQLDELQAPAIAFPLVAAGQSELNDMKDMLYAIDKFPFIIHAVTAASGDGDTFVGRIFG